MDVDPGPQGPVLWLQYTNTHELPSPVEEESTTTLALTGFYYFSMHITWRTVLIYYA